MSHVRLYPGISVSAIANPHVESALRTIDQHIRDLGPALEKDHAILESLLVGAFPNVSYVTVNDEHAIISQARRLVATAPLSVADGGAGTQITISLNTSSLAGTPAFTYSTAFGPGVASTFVRTDAQIKFPSSIMSPTSSALITASDDGVNMTIVNTLGDLIIDPLAGLQLNPSGGRIVMNLANSASLSSVIIAPNATATESVALSVQGRPLAGSRTLINSNWFGAGATNLDNLTLACWAATYSSFTGILGATTPVTLVGFDASAFTFSPNAGSGTTNNLYVFRGAPTLSNNNAGFADAATGFFRGVRRSIAAVTTITTQAAVIVEPPTASAMDQYGIKIRNAISEQVVATTNRIGIDIDASNSTAPQVMSIRTGNRCEFPVTSEAYAPGSFTIQTGRFSVMSGTLQLTGTQLATLLGTARLRIT